MVIDSYGPRHTDFEGNMRFAHVDLGTRILRILTDATDF
jgi:hypothetical protein